VLDKIAWSPFSHYRAVGTGRPLAIEVPGQVRLGTHAVRPLVVTAVRLLVVTLWGSHQ